MSPSLRRCVQLLVGVFLTGVILPALAQLPAQASEVEVKAAYLYRFLSFVEWPAQRFASPQTPLVLAVAGAPALAEELRRVVQGRTAQDRPIAVREVAAGENAFGAHLLFVGETAAGRLDGLAHAVDPATLVVADGELALDEGAMIGFVERQGRLRFVVALDTAERAGLRLNPRMLAVATAVRGRP